MLNEASTMMKRNGQLCEHTVPDYSGRLTDAEFLAYNSVFGAVEKDFNVLTTVSKALAEIENSFTHLVEAAKTNQPERAVVVEPLGGSWDVISSLLKVDGTEMLWCKQRFNDTDSYGIVQRLDSDSPLAKAQGECSLQVMGLEARGLLRDFLHELRDALGLYATDIVADTHERLAEKYPGQDMDRVAKAIEARCAKQISSEQIMTQAQTPSRREGIRV
jgi:hypothetical protein